MRHWLWAVALAAITAGSVRADYLIIRYNIGGKAASASNSPGTPVGGSGDLRPGGGVTTPGFSPPGAIPGGNPGAAGGPRGQMPPGLGSMPPRGGAQQNVPGPGGQLSPAGGGLRPGGSAPGMMPGGMPGNMPGGSGFGQAGSNDEDTYETFVIAVVEVGSSMHENEKLNMKQYIHKWGYTKAYNDNATIQTFLVKAPSLEKRFSDRRISSEKQNADSILSTAANFALNHGMVEKCIDVLEEVSKKPDLSPYAKKVIDAYTQVKADLSKASAGSDAVNAWKGRLPDYKVIYSNDGHYALFYNSGEPTTPPEVERRLALLERNMKAFYLWFVLKGKALPVPTDKMVAIQVNSADEFKVQRNALGDVQLVSDGFFAPRDNVVVFSSKRTDEAYNMFAEQTRTYWAQGWNREDLLKGKEPPKGAKEAAGGTKKELMQRDLPRMQTLALLEKALEEESEIAAVSHEGSRQLAVASGLISRVVEMPEWLEFGIGSLFETPKGPYAGVDGAAQVAFWPSYGAPNWAYIRQWKKWSSSKDEATKLDDAPVALKKTVQDIYAHQVRLPVNTEISPNLSPSERAKREKELARAKEDVTRARAYAWSLTYYLAKHHLDELLGYFKNMDNLPPDLELDGRTVLLTFAKSFKLTNAAGEVDEEALTKLANDWYKQMGSETAPGNDIHLDAPKPKPKEENQGFPGFPGGQPGVPGGQPGLPGGMPGRPGGGRGGPG
ncbi:MAG TPA: DUF1570 domain-containing protein [Gemmataceae bacterium]|nr:DUF1570 domain-containing protein [Gemmataceae bacterium]